MSVYTDVAARWRDEDKAIIALHAAVLTNNLAAIEKAVENVRYTHQLLKEAIQKIPLARGFVS